MGDISRGTNAVFQKGQRVEQYQIVEVLTPTRFIAVSSNGSREESLISPLTPPDVINSSRMTPDRSSGFAPGQYMYQPIQVLIEILRAPLLDEFKEDFLKSAQVLKNLEHPHILRVRDIGVHQHYPFLVTDYLPYRTFSQVYAQLRRGSGLPLPSQPLMMLLPHLKQVASALQYAHSRYVLHGDIRPANILLSAHNTILLRGFLLEAIMQNGERRDEPHRYRGMEAVEHEAMIYAAPEQIQGNISFVGDQYALGILIYELLCGEVPFTGSSVEIAFQKIHAPVPSLRQKMANRISPDVERVVMKALEKEPERRFPDVQAFINALEQEQSQPPENLASTVQPTVIITPLPVVPPVMPFTAPGDFSGTVPTSQVPPASFLGKTLQMPVSPTFQSVAPMRVPPPDSPPGEPVEQIAQKFNETTSKVLPLPSEPPAQRPEGASVVRRVFFAIGLVGLAALGGAGGWYHLSHRLSHTASPVVSSHTGPSATKTTINNQEGLIFTGHLASVNALAWSPDSKFVASASDDTFVQVFESATGTRSIIYKGHTEEVAAVAWSPNGHFIASAGQDQTVQVWNAASGGAAVFTYKRHTDRVNSVSWSSDGDLLASGSDDKSVQVWQASSGDRSFAFLGHTAGVLCVGWQPNDSSVASGSWDGTLRDWATIQHGNHFAAGEQIFDYGGHGNNEVYALAWSPDSNFIVSAGADQTIQISNGDDGTPMPPFFTDHQRKDHINCVFAVSWSPDGTSVASGDGDGNVYVWRVAGRKTLFKYSGHKGTVNAVAWSPDGKFIASASADNTVHVWSPAGYPPS